MVAGSKFNVGDRVRVLRKTGRSMAEVGAVGEVTDTEFAYTVEFDNRGALAYDGDDIEHAPLFAVGDKVRVVKGTCLLDEGKTYTVVEDPGDSGEFDVFVVVGEHGILGYEAARFEPVAVAASNDNADALRIEAGKFYKTRDGRKVGPMEVYSDSFEGKHPWQSEGYLWQNDGTNYDGTDDPRTIIAEWPTTTNAAAQVDNLRDEYGPYGAVSEAKFKVGDRVRCRRNNGAPPYFTVGNDYIVAEVEPASAHESGVLVYCLPDVPNEFGCTTPVGQFGDAWEVITTPAIVCLIDNGQPLPSHRPHVHATTEAATTEAERLAAQSPGRVFGVYELTTRRVADVTVREVA